MKKIAPVLVVFLFSFFCCRGNACIVCGHNKKMTSQDKSMFEQKLDSSLSYIEGVSGKEGIKRCVVLKNGKCVFAGDESETVQKIWSCTKSFTSTVLGLLIAEEKCSLDDKVCNYLPELKECYPEITFRHLVTMTSGYRATGDEPRGNYSHGPSYTPCRPSPAPLFAPGNDFMYWDSAMNLLALALTKVAKESIENIFLEKIAAPIGICGKKWKWENWTVSDGIKINGGAGNNNWGISISAKEFAKFGQLMLQKGNWDGKQILPAEWIKEATSPQVKNIIPENDTPYGFCWWTDACLQDAPRRTFMSKGFNNNKCIVIPKWDMVIVRLGLDGNIEDKEWNHFFEIMGSAF